MRYPEGMDGQKEPERPLSDAERERILTEELTGDYLARLETGDLHNPGLDPPDRELLARQLAIEKRADQKKIEQLERRMKEGYLARLPEVDRNNLTRIIELFKTTLQQENRSGSLLAVGGTLTKPLPRPDIDLVVIFQPNPADPQKQQEENYYQFSVRDFQIFRTIVEQIIKGDERFLIETIYEPAIDEEFDIPSILKHDGSIIITNKVDGGTPIEIVRIPTSGDYRDVMHKQKSRPYVILAEVPKKI